MTYGVEFRCQVLLVREREGLTFAETCERFSVGVASLTRWTRHVEPKAPREGGPRKIDLEKLMRDGTFAMTRMPFSTSVLRALA